MRLYEIAAEIEAHLNATVNPETGEIDEAALARLEELELSRDQLCLAVAAYLKGQRAEAEALKAASKRQTERAQIHQNHADRLEAYIQSVLPIGTRIQDANSTIRWRKSHAVAIDNEDEIPDAFFRVKREPDKRFIATTIEAGDTVKGAHLVERHSVQIR